MRLEKAKRAYLDFGDEAKSEYVAFILNYEDLANKFDFKCPLEDHIWSEYDPYTYQYAYKTAIEEGKSEEEAEEAGRRAEEEAEGEWFDQWLGYIKQRIDEICDYINIVFTVVEVKTDEYKYNEYRFESDDWKDALRRILAVEKEYEPEDITEDDLEWERGDLNWIDAVYKKLGDANSEYVPSGKWIGQRGGVHYRKNYEKKVGDYAIEMMNR